MCVCSWVHQLAPVLCLLEHVLRATTEGGGKRRFSSSHFTCSDTFLHRFGASSETEAKHFDFVLCVLCEVGNGYASLLAGQHELFGMTGVISRPDHDHKGVQSVLLSRPRQPKALRGDFRDQEGLDLWLSLWATGKV